VITVDDDVVLELFETMDAKIDSIETDNKALKTEIELLKSNPHNAEIPQAVECTCEPERIWKDITLTFIKDQEKAFDEYKHDMKNDLNQMQTRINKLQDGIGELRKQ